MTHVALAFEVPGGWHQDKYSTALTVLQVSKLLVDPHDSFLASQEKLTCIFILSFCI